MDILNSLGEIGSNVYLLLVYSGIVILVYHLLPGRWRVSWLLLGSLFFYAVCAVRFLALLLAETVLTWRIGGRIAACRGTREGNRGGNRRPHGATERDREEEEEDGDSSGRAAKGWLIAGIVLVLGVLFFFKCEDFFRTAFSLQGTELVLPLGISYYSFRMISYLSDLFLGKRKEERSLQYYAVYVMFFPQLLSGPIARSEAMLEELHAQRKLSSDDLAEGLRLIVSGLFKKVVIADRIGGYATAIFASPESYPALAVWMGAVLYSIQLYCDFAGYSEIAIGITRCCGLSCPANFCRPYLSRNMKEFWRRWHISLSSWLRDYIYIPCGGSRTDRRWKVSRNVLLTFAACGLWHGSGVRYLVWGLYHGLWNVVTPRRKTLALPAEEKREEVGPIHRSAARKAAGAVLAAGARGLCCLSTFLIAMFGWILFKAESFPAAAGYVRCMFRSLSLSMASVQAAVLPFTGDNSCAAYAMTSFVLIAVLFVMEVREEQAEGKAREGARGRAQAKSIGMSDARFGILLALVLLFGMRGTGGFLYANY